MRRNIKEARRGFEDKKETSLERDRQLMVSDVAEHYIHLLKLLASSTSSSSSDSRDLKLPTTVQKVVNEYMATTAVRPENDEDEGEEGKREESKQRRENVPLGAPSKFGVFTEKQVQELRRIYLRLKA